MSQPTNKTPERKSRKTPISLNCIDLGLQPYRYIWDLQERLRQERLCGKMGNLLIFCEHPPVYTVGKQHCESDWLSSNREIAEAGIDIVYSNRGGRITYHGPGQLVCYLIVRVSDYSSGVKDFVRRLEVVCMGMIGGLGLVPSLDRRYPGVWLEGGKVVAIGLNVSHGISIHGLAINVSPDLSHYRHIVPCGMGGLKVTSLENELREGGVSMEEVKKVFLNSFGKVFGCRVENMDSMSSPRKRLFLK